MSGSLHMKDFPRPRLRKLAFAAGFAAAFLAYALPAQAQGISILRDTETEEMLRSYETPLARAAGLDPVPRVWLVGDPSINAFASYGDGGENIFVFSGILLWLHSPNELIGVMAHETGHISAGHLSRGSYGMQKAMIPMLLSMAAGVAAMIAGAGEAGMAIMGVGQAYAMGQMAAFTRVQESTADQIAAKLLLATHQSPMGMYHTFQRFANEEAMSDKMYQPDKFAVDHPSGQDRVFDLNDMVESSPYREVQDSPQALHTFQMVQAKLAGYVLPVKDALNRFPETDTSEPARYARAMVYMRQPNFQKALSTINSLLQDEPNNPYFYEVRGQLYMSMAKPAQAIPDYEKSVALRPGAPQLRLALATALLATDNPAVADKALANLKAAVLVENDDVFTWYQTAQAYSMLKNEPMANLSTAELWYNAGDMQKAIVFATRARGKLPQGGPDWQRAQDIIGAAGPQARQQRG
ncbi:MAG TPA: M48 family metalloprotease [Rhizomicrobium sp.]|jgi:predicted Zn-dependent protease|nr:M48 family metalloprotease [Rhizomicrobium sp.]